MDGTNGCIGLSWGWTNSIPYPQGKQQRRYQLAQRQSVEELGLELVAEGFYKVFFRDVEIGEFDAEAMRFRPVQVLR